jgi:hypothetical protein
MQPRRNGIDPIIDEDMVCAALDVTPNRENARQVQSGAFMLVVDAFDRKVTRDQFIATIGAATSLIDAVARVSLMVNVKNHLSNHGMVTTADVETAAHGCMELARQANVECQKMASLIKKCALAEDPIH